MCRQNEALKCIIACVFSWPRSVNSYACPYARWIVVVDSFFVLLAFHVAIAACLQLKYALSGLLTTKQIICLYAIQFRTDWIVHLFVASVFIYLSFASSLHVY